jgi:4-amino-4-deoxy-L-arabinose transferase-like glycosyltransferase
MAEMQDARAGRGAGGRLAGVIPPDVAWLIVLLAMTALLVGVNLDGYPRLGFDESFYLQLAKNLAQHGEYALLHPAQPTDWFGWGNSSPTLGLPVALGFRLLGVGVIQGRIIAAAYALGLTGAVYGLLRYLYGWRAAALGAALFLVAGPVDANSILLGRRVLGEVPALAFVLLGVWRWYRAWEDGRLRELVGAGFLFGLAFVTKEQFIIFVMLTGGLVWLADRIYYRQLRLRVFVVPLLLSGLPIGVWYGLKLVVLGPEAFGQHLAALSSVSRASTWLFAPATWAGHIGFLYSHAFLLLGLPGILYALALSCSPTLKGLQSLFLPLLATLFLAWFVFISIGWSRYSYPGLALASLLAGKPLSDLMAGLEMAPTRLWAGLRNGTMTRQAVTAIVVLLVIGYPVQDQIRQALSAPDRSPQEFAAFVEGRTEPEALIESYVWEITFLTSRRFHYPPPEVFVQALTSDLDGTYDPAEYEVRYLIDGPYSKAVQLYPAAWLSQCCEMLGAVGPYDLYALRDLGSP